MSGDKLITNIEDMGYQIYDLKLEKESFLGSIHIWKIYQKSENLSNNCDVTFCKCKLIAALLLHKNFQ